MPRLDGPKRIAGVLGVVVILGSIGWVLNDGLTNRWVSEQNQWANQGVRSSLAAVHEVVADAGPRPNILVMNYNDTDDETGTNTAYGWVKTFTNVFRTGIPGDMVKYNATYLGTAENFLAGERTTGASEGYNDASQKHFDEIQTRLSDYPEDPVVFLIGQYYKGLCNGVTECSDDVEQERLQAALDSRDRGRPRHVRAPGRRALHAAAGRGRSRRGGRGRRADPAREPPGRVREPAPHAARPARAVLPRVPAGAHRGAVVRAAGRAQPRRLIPGMSIVLTLLSGIAVLAVWRGPLTTTKAWVVVGVAIAVALGFRVGATRLNRVLGSFGGFFNNMFSVFSNRAYATLVGVQFLVQGGQGVIQGAFAKSIAFGGEKGFDVTVVPSAQYLLKVVLALYVPYTLVSPFIGVGIDRFERRRVLSLSNIVTAVVVSIVALAVMLPLGKETSEGNVGATVALIVGLLFIQGCTRVALAVKSAAIPDVLSGKDLLQGNGLSQAGGALFQVVGIGFAFGAAAAFPSWIVVVIGAGVLIVAALVANRLERMETEPHETTFGQEAKQVVSSIVAG